MPRDGQHNATLERMKEFAAFVKDKKGRQKLHALSEQRLAELLTQIYPDAAPIPEVSGVLGGRNDLIQFFFNGRRVVFEMFFSPSQVPQDLRLLEQSSADVKIAILLDREVDPRLATEYFRKKPESFPFLWLSQILVSSHAPVTRARLRELIDEDPTILKLRRVLASPMGNRVDEYLRPQLEKLEKVVFPSVVAPQLRDLTVGQMIALRSIEKVAKMGVPPTKLRSLFEWLQGSIEYAFTLVGVGMQAFLVTDLKGRHAIWSDGDFADDVILGAEKSDEAAVVLCLNRFVNDAWEAHGLSRKPLSFHFKHSYHEVDELLRQQNVAESSTGATENSSE
jgi:hypothetical protein